MEDTFLGITIGLIVKGAGRLNDLNKKFEKIRDSIAKTGKDITKLNQKFEKMSTTSLGIRANKEKINNELSNIGVAIAKFGTLAVPVKVAVDFESAMVDVKKYIDFESDAQFKQMGDDIKTLSSELGMNFAEVADIAASGGQQGLKASQIMDYTKLVSKFGVAFDMSGRDAGDAAAYVMNNFKLTTKELEKLGNQMNFLDDKMSMVKSSDLFNILNRTSSNASLLKLSADAAAALGASLLSVGKTPEVAATALNSMYNSLANLDGQDEKFHKALEKMGMDAEYLKAAIAIDPSKAVQEFILAIGRIDSEKQMGVLTDMFGKQFSDEIGSLVVNTDILNNAFDLIQQNSSGSLDEALELKLSTAQSSFERFKATAMNLGITIGNAFLPVVNILTEALTNITSFLYTLLNKFPRVTNVVLGTVSGFLALGVMLPVAKIISAGVGISFGGVKLLFHGVSFLTTAFKLQYLSTLKLNAAYMITQTSMKTATFFTKAYGVVLNALKFIISRVTRAFKFLVGSIRAVSVAMMSSPLGVALGAIAIVAGLVIYNWDKVKVWFVSFIEWLRLVWEPVVQGIKQIWESVSSFFGVLIDRWKLIFSSVAEFMGLVFVKPVEYIKGLFAPLFDWLAEKFGWVGSALDGLKSGVNTALGWVGLGGDDEKEASVKSEKKSKWYNPFSWGSDDDGDSWSEPNIIETSFAPASQTPALALANGGSMPVNIHLNGDFNIATSNGKFDLAEFERQVTQSVKRAMQKESFNRQNRDIRG